VLHIEEAYTGVEGPQTNGLVALKKGDVVFNNAGKSQLVTYVDPDTLIPVFTSTDDTTESTVVDPDSLELGLAYKPPQITSRMFIDYATEPATIVVDAHYTILDKAATQIKVFMGRDTSDGGQVISHTVNTSGVIMSEMVDVEPIDVTLPAIRRPLRFNTTTDIPAGQVLTAVIYANTGKIIGEDIFVAVQSRMISGPSAASVYIDGISLVSPMLSTTDALVIENPFGHSFTGSSAACLLHYSNGRSVTMPIDGNKVILHGLDSFDSSRMGSNTSVVLSYYPGEDEPAINVRGVTTPSIAKTYTLVNIPISGDYRLRAYIIPHWDVASGWALRVLLTDVEYAVYIDVTEYAELRDALGNPLTLIGDGTMSRVHMSIDLSGMTNDTYDGYVHTQKLDIALPTYSDIDVEGWRIDYGCDGMTVYGTELYARVSQAGSRPFKIDCGLADVDKWLATLYRGLDPSYDNTLYSEAPTPTSFRLEHGGVDGDMVIGTFPIVTWDAVLYLGTGREWLSGKPLNIVWLLDSLESTKVLAVSPLPVKFLYV